MSVFEAMAMYEHVLNLDSVFCAKLLFGLEDMLFRIMLSDEVCVWETFSKAVIRHLAPWDGCTPCFESCSLVLAVLWQTPVMVCGTRCQGQSACMKGKRRHLACGPLNHSSGVECLLSLMFGV